MDNTHQMSTTMPSFNFSLKNKNSKNDWTSMVQNSRKNDQNSREIFKSKNEQNTFDSLGGKSKIPEESRGIILQNTSNPSQSRNMNIFDARLLDGNYSYKNFKSK